MKKSLHAILLCLIGVCLSGSSSYASFLGDIGVIEVRGEREPRLATESALYIETFMADDLIATGKTNLSSILDSESGMQVHYAGSGTLSGLSIRGVSGGQTNNKTAVYLDGAPVSTMRRGFVLESFPAETIDRIDLIRGPASALFGDGSLNGAINITSILSRKNITNLNSHGGSFDEYGGSFLINRAPGNSKYAVAGSFMDTSGHDKNPATLINGYTAFETMQGRNTFSFSARGFLAERDSKVYAPRTGAYMRMTNDIEHLLGFFRMGWSGYLAGNFSSLKLYYNTESEKSSDLDREEGETLGGIFEYLIKPTARMRIYLGADVSKDEFSGESKNSRLNYAPYAQTNISLDRTTLSAGLRYDASENEDGVISPHISITRALSPSINLLAGYNAGFRRPTVSEMYSKNLNLFGDPDLKPEQSENYEVALSYSSESLGLKLNIFQMELDNLIVSREPEEAKFYNSKPIQKALMNVKDEAVYRGIETSAEIAISRFSSLNIKYYFLDPGKLTFHTSAHTVSCNLKFFNDRHKLSIIPSGRFGRYIWDDSEGKQEDLILLGINYSLELTPNIGFFINAENILDEEYSLYFLNPMPGRNFTAGLRAEF